MLHHTRAHLYRSVLEAVCYGFAHHLTDNLDRMPKEAAQLLNGVEANLIAQRVGIIKTSLVNTPKSSKWRLRSLAGRRIPWYELPEEVD